VLREIGWSVNRPVPITLRRAKLWAKDPFFLQTTKLVHLLDHSFLIFVILHGHSQSSNISHGGR